MESEKTNSLPYIHFSKIDFSVTVWEKGQAITSLCILMNQLIKNLSIH